MSTFLYAHKSPAMKRLRLWMVVPFLALPLLCNAQDLHYSQFYNAPLQYNPALTGIFNGDIRLMGNYKSQWVDVPVDYQTVTLAVDKKFLGVANDDGFFSAGAAFNYDRAGDSRLTWLNLDLNGSYTRVITPKIIITGGVKAAFIQRSFDENNLRFNAQYDEPRGVFDPSLANGENFNSNGNFFTDFSAGLNLRLQQEQTSDLVFRNDRRTKADIGIALFHLTAPDQSFFDDRKVPLERRLSPYVMGNLMLTQKFDLTGAATLQSQGSFYDAFMGMAGARFWLSNTINKQISIMAGMGMRRDEVQDAYWPTFEIGYNQWRVGLNYDFNVSRFDIATENRGGMELSVQYIIRKVRPLPEFKVCPIL